MYMVNFQELHLEVDFPDVIIFSSNWQIKIIEGY